METQDFKNAMFAKSLAISEADNVNNKDDPLTSFSLAVNTFKKKFNKT